VERKAVAALAAPRISFVRKGKGEGGDGCMRRRSSVAASSSDPADASPTTTSTSSPWPPADPSLLPQGPAAPFLLSRPSPEEIVAVNFYHLVDLGSARATRKRHENFLKDKDVRGRIYIAPQGINAQFSAPAGVAADYLIWVRNESERGEEDEGESASSSPPSPAAHRSLLETMRANAEPSPRGEHLFPKLRLKYKPNLISLAGGTASLPITDSEARAAPLSPREWQEMLLLSSSPSSASDGENENDRRLRPIVLDVRNAYEWDAGHFAGAERPLEDNFCETPTDATTRAATAGEESGDDDENESASEEENGDPSSSPLGVPAYLASAPKDAPVMMYCTGGIRCDIYSAHLRKKGFTNLYTLEGGVHNYFREAGGKGWEGSLFVFDARMAVAPKGDDSAVEASGSNEEGGKGGGEGEGAPPLPAAAPCLLCGGPAALPHLNCSNIDCNRLFISCRACATKLSGCCCEACVSAPRLLRPAKVSGYYGTWASEAEELLASVGDKEAAAASLAAARAAMSSGRGSGRLARRRARAERLSQERAAAKEERLRKKAAAKAELAKRGGGRGGDFDGGEGEGEGGSERKKLGEERQGGGEAAADDDERTARLAKLEALRSRLLIRR